MVNPIRFTLEEVFSSKEQKIIPISLQVPNNPINYKTALIRLLTGTINIRCNYRNVLIKQRTNYSTIPPSHNTKIKSEILQTAIQPKMELSDLANYVNETQTQNYKFYRELFYEFSFYFLRKKEKNEEASFLHLYRILESIAYCFPLIWAASAKDYEGTFTKLKSYFNGQNTAELGFFHRFMDDTISSTLRNTPVTFNIKSIYPEWQECYYKTICKSIQNNKNISNDSIVSYTEFSRITVKCDCLLDLMISIRNRYFHFQTGHGNNLNSEDIVDTNEFFNILNEIMANWLAIIIFETISFEIKF